MNRKGREYRASNDLSYGDIIWIKAPFEENTSIYYNGYNPRDVRGKLIKNARGETAKVRPVMVVNVSPSHLSYIPLTSSHGEIKHDIHYQYKLIDNSMVSDVNLELDTYAEVEHVRFISTKPEYTYQYRGKVIHEDLKQITNLFDKYIIPSNQPYDTVKYMTNKGKTKTINYLNILGYEQKEKLPDKPDITVYKKDNVRVTLRENDNLVFYHYKLSIEEIRKLHGIENPEKEFEQNINKLSIDKQSERLL